MEQLIAQVQAIPGALNQGAILHHIPDLGGAVVSKYRADKIARLILRDLCLQAVVELVEGGAVQINRRWCIMVRYLDTT